MCPGGAQRPSQGNHPQNNIHHHHPKMEVLGSKRQHNHAFGPVDEEEQENCRHCGSRALHVDWAQGDKVCMDCGVVSEEKLRETRPEWRDHNEAEDLAKGLPSASRSGLVPVDESRYLGGLQPTTMSKHPYGGTSASGMIAAKEAAIRKKLVTTNRKLDYMMGQRHSRALKQARISRLVRKRQLMDETDQSDLDSVATGAEDDVRPELEQILIQEEEDVHRMQSSLNADKWSLRRAILLHGHHDSMDDHDAAEAERDDLERRLDSKLRKASADLYKAYQMLVASSNRLQLPDRVTHEATNMLCKYAARRDGFVVKGVSSRLATKKANITAAQQKQAAESLREHNKLKQMGSLCAALLLLTARKLGWPRPLAEVCGCVQPPARNTSSPYSTTDTTSTFVKPKHCSRAMEEIKVSFPDFARAIATSQPFPTNSNAAAEDDTNATINFVDHAVRKLQLPPVAEASIRALVWHVRQDQLSTGRNSGTKLSTICASLAYFMCQAGSVMQRLAQQAQIRDQSTTSHGSNSYKKRKSKFSHRHSYSHQPTMMSTSTKFDSECMGPPPPKMPKTVISDNKEVPTSPAAAKSSQDDNDKDDKPFDVFSHDVGSDLLEQKREYEMRRMWDTWANQTTWFRTLADVEQSSGVSGNVILSHYKSDVYPKRRALLEWLKEAVDNDVNTSIATVEKEEKTSAANDQTACTILTEIPLASTLLSHVPAAASLMNNPAAANSKTRF